MLARAGDTLESMGKKYGLSVASMERIALRGRGETLKRRQGRRVCLRDGGDAEQRASEDERRWRRERDGKRGRPRGPSALGREWARAARSASARADAGALA